MNFSFPGICKAKPQKTRGGLNSPSHILHNSPSLYPPSTHLRLLPLARILRALAGRVRPVFNTAGDRLQAVADGFGASGVVDGVVASMALVVARMVVFVLL